MTRMAACALACAFVLAGSARAGGRIDIPLGPDLYGNGAAYADGKLEGYTQAAQSFIALGDRLVSVSAPVYQQFGDIPFLWRYQLWNDVDNHPGEVVATFGSFDPTLQLQYFAVTLDTPIPLQAGKRYYVGFAPDPAQTFPTGAGESNFVTLGWRSSVTQDLYADGTVWMIARPGPVGEYLFQTSDFDYSMQISMVPEPSTLLLLLLGAGALRCFIGARRRS